MFDVIVIAVAVVALIKGRIPFSRTRYVPAIVSRISAAIMLVLLIGFYATGQSGMHAVGILFVFLIVAALASKTTDTQSKDARESMAQQRLSQATKLEVKGDIELALKGYEDIITEYAETAVARDAQICLDLLRKKANIQDPK